MRSLRAVVSAIGLSVAIITTVSAPIGYFVIGYSNLASVLYFQADLNSRYLAKYIYGHDTLWQYQRARLAELLEQDNVNNDVVRKRVFDSDGVLVLDEGAHQASPVIVQTSPTVVGGAVVGRVEIETSLRTLLWETGQVGLLSFLLGFGVFLAVRVLPLKVLDQTLGRLESTNRQLDGAVNNIIQGLAMFDASGRMVVCNRRYIEMYRLSPDVAKPGSNLRDLVRHRKDAGTFLGDVEEYCAALETAIAQGKAATLIAELPDGRSIQVVSGPMTGGGWVATHEDVTERHRLLQARQQADSLIREQKFHLDSALNNMCHGLCMFDAEARIVLFNRRYVEMMELSAETLIGLSLPELLKRRKASGHFTGDAELFFASVMEAVRAGKPTTRIMETYDGRALRVIDQPVAGGGWVAAFEDITEQRRVERERDRNRHFLELIIENVPATIFVKQASDRRYVLVNRAGEKFWGMPRAEIIGKTSSEVFPNSEAKLIAARDDELLQSGQPAFTEREISTPGGVKRTIASRRLIIHDEDGKSKYLLGVVEDITEQKQAAARIAHLAHYDALTDLPNRVLLRERLEHEVTYAGRGAQLAVLYLDLDHFKGINDTLGHSPGDALLKAVAGQLQSCLRPSDMIARLGGDEFAVVQAPLDHPTDAATLAQRLREAVTQTSYDLDGHQVVIDLSIGIALFPTDGTDVDQLLKSADMALYGAKSDGRGTFHYFQPEMDARMKKRRTLEVDLRKALAGHQFELHYQPILDLRTDGIACCEALLRWHHPERGLISPADFIPVAEETGLIIPIGEWVLRQACADAAKWRNDIKVAVNLSPAQFRNQALLQVVIGSLAASGLSPGRLELEITESVLLQKNDKTLEMLHELRGMGVRIAMDDFGTGYSSLSYLRSFPFDKIKIDQSFIRDLLSSSDSPKIVESVIRLARSLNMAVTAEGVELKQQLDVLREMDCTEMQGFLFSTPRPVEEILPLVAEKPVNARRSA
jgi:diguanylate cyclase (GGDEF)-like protein/PAS domain S-box-containing protein